MTDEMRTVLQQAGCLDLALDCEKITDPHHMTPEEAAKMKRMDDILKAHYRNKNYAM